ncbi:hypothetical protein OUZ56_031574 [Daphnia magna]|uniref:Uncharacterized protein n=1 Tax=Daphnia magna TaxID=35525 RepID=A0ABQ9ZVF7_9CRUS|nr:hypothetical protein OUZ56_031574 [Daphnia magna]
MNEFLICFVASPPSSSAVLRPQQTWKLLKMIVFRAGIKKAALDKHGLTFLYIGEKFRIADVLSLITTNVDVSMSYSD